jgi:hypothetical protein
MAQAACKSCKAKVEVKACKSASCSVKGAHKHCAKGHKV